MPALESLGSPTEILERVRNGRTIEVGSPSRGSILSDHYTLRFRDGQFLVSLFVQNHDAAGPTGDDSGNYRDRVQTEAELLKLITECIDWELEREWANKR